MMRQMREATKPIMLLAAFAFLLLMVFEWGMDITGRSGGGMGEIGSVDGDPVMYDAYMAAYRQIYEQVQAQQEELIGTAQNSEIEDRAFEEIVTQILINQELERRGITVTNQEISEAARFSPPDYLRPQFLDQSGNFDLAAYQSFLATLPPEQLLILEAYYRDVIPRSKLLRQLGAGIWVSDAQLWQQWKDQNQLAEIRYVPLNPATRYEDSEFTISADEIRDYYRTHEEEFEVPARASIRFTVLDKTPTAADSAAARERAVGIRARIAEGEDFAQVARAESADRASAPVGGEMGVFSRGEQIGPLDSAVFAASPGLLAEPVRTSFGYHVVDVMERWGADSVQARHVLVPIDRTDDSEIRLLARADSLEDFAEEMALEQAASRMGLTVRTTDITLDFPFIAGAGQITEGADWIFEEAAPGDVSPVFETSAAFYALELLSSEEAGVMPLETATPAIESTLRFERKMQRAREEAQQVVDRARSGEALANVAADMSLEVRTAGPFARDDFVPGVGRYNAVVGAAFGLPVGEVSDVVSTATNQYVVEVLDRTEPDSAAWRQQLQQQRQQAVAMIQQQRLQEWIQALRANARVVDRRDIVFAPADEDAVQFPMGF
ncbi:MAG TPA: peptidyl-prolyl cis-trans isomerase [Longimicrobiales bacterium]|nr:peptidyl-prolyl cis-trans isomerase [Longimicrobiales bacterium]